MEMNPNLVKQNWDAACAHIDELEAQLAEARAAMVSDINCDWHVDTSLWLAAHPAPPAEEALQGHLCPDCGQRLLYGNGHLNCPATPSAEEGTDA